MTRARRSLRPPPLEPAALRSFPRRTVAADTMVFRVVRRGNGPWWFSSDGSGRYDLAPPAGTCYLATSAVGALLELVGPELADAPAIGVDALADREVRELRLPEPVRLADITSRRAAGFGVTAELATVVPYDLPQAWAAAFAAARFGGIRTALRHDPAQRPEGIALFGAAGERTRWRRGRARAVADPLLGAFEAETGIRVLRRPTLAALDVYRPGP